MIYELKELEAVAPRERTKEQEQYALESFYDNAKKLAAGHSWDERKKLTLLTGVQACSASELQLGYLYFLSKAYSAHKKIVLAPHDIWFVLLSELSGIIQSFPEECRPLFTKSDDKVEVLTPAEDGQIDPAAVIRVLRSFCPTDVDLFLPSFSTAGADYQVAAMATFVGSLEAYYNYMTFCCGIPAIKVAGSKEDWLKIGQNFDTIVTLLAGVGISTLREKNPYEGRGGIKSKELEFKKWSDRVSEICTKVAGCLDGISLENSEFLSSIFTQKNIGSGGELEINGWITEIFCSLCSTNKIENFTATVGRLPYASKSSGREYVAIYGPFGQKLDHDGFLATVYDKIVYQKASEPKVE